MFVDINTTYFSTHSVVCLILSLHVSVFMHRQRKTLALPSNNSGNKQPPAF